MLTWIQHLSVFEYCCNRGSAQGPVIFPLLPSVFLCCHLSFSHHFFFLFSFYFHVSYLYHFVGITHSHIQFGAYHWQGNDRAWQTLSIITNLWCNNCCVCQLYWCPYRAHSGAVGWGTAVEAWRSRVRFLMVSLEFLIDIILLVALWPWGWLSL